MNRLIAEALSSILDLTSRLADAAFWAQHSTSGLDRDMKARTAAHVLREIEQRARADREELEAAIAKEDEAAV